MSTSEKIKDAFIEKGILICQNCFILHCFQIYYSKKEDKIKLKFECPIITKEYSLEFFLQNLNEFYIKCSNCEKILKYEEGIYSNKINEFKCENCKAKIEGKKLSINLNNEEYKFSVKKIDKLYFTESEEQQKFELFQKYKKEIILLKLFTEIILYNISYDDLSDRKIICQNFIDLFGKFIDIVLENQNYYDVYSIVKELSLYGNKYESIFNSDYYKILINNVSKQKFLALNLFEYIKSKFKIQNQYNNFINLFKFNLKKEIVNTFYIDSSIYNEIVKYITTLKNEEKIKNLESQILNLNNNNLLNNYYLSYFLIPPKIILKRKNINILLSKILSNNFVELKEIIPSQNMLKTIIKEISSFKNENISIELKNKLKDFNEKLLKEYGYIIPLWRNKNKISIQQQHPYITFSLQEIEILNQIKSKKIINKQELETDNLILQIAIDFLFYLKEKGNEFSHLINSNSLKFYNDFQTINNLSIKENNFQNLKLIIENEIKIKDISEELSIEDIVNNIFEVYQTETIFNKKNKVDFILEKYNNELKNYSESIEKFNELKQKLDKKENEMKEYINYIMENYSENDEKLFEQYDKLFKIKNCYNNVIQYFKAIFNSTIINLDNENKLSLIVVSKNEKIMINLKKFNKFKIYKNLYLKKLLYEEIKKNKEKFLKEIKEQHTLQINLFLLLNNMILIKNILEELENFSYNIEKMFNDFINDKYFDVVIKKRKISENEKINIQNKINIKDIFKYILKIIDLKEKVNITQEDTGDFLFKLFKLKIGYPI